MTEERTYRWIGQGVARVDASDKLRGKTLYTDDLDIPGCWHGCVVRSPVSHGVLKGLKQDPSFDWSQVVVATPEDIPGVNIVVMHDRSMPLLATGQVLYIGEPLAVVAAPTLSLAREAARHIQAEIDPLPAVWQLRDVVAQFKKGDNSWTRLCAQTIKKGDVRRGFAEADFIVEGEYSAGHQEQLYIEPQALVAIPQADGGVLIEGSMQCPYFIVHELHEALNLPPEKLRVRQAAVGGAFGGKEEYPSMLAGYCALPAMKSGRPVKIVYDRNEDILYTTKRHPVWSRYKAGVKKDGTITAMEVDFILDGGAYLTLSDVVMFRGVLHAAQGYRCEHVYVNGLVAQTHTFPSGAFRGFGAPQAIWGLESHIDKMAQACGMAPHEFRLKNCLRQGDVTPTGQVLSSSCGSPAVLEQALERSDFSVQLAQSTRGRKDARLWRGVGLSFFAHGSGFTGDGEAKINAIGAVELDRLEDGRPGLVIRVSSTEMGQGALTVFSQIAADGAGVELERVRYPFADTALVPNSGPTVASRTTMVVGSCVFSAARKLKEKLDAFAVEAGMAGAGFDAVAAAWLEKSGVLRMEHRFALPPNVRWNQKTFEGDAYPGYSWGCNVAEVEVDPRTLEIKVPRVYACFDIGRLINPVLAKGQIEGGLTQALGYAIMEKIGIKNGKYDADRLQTYVIPTALDAPRYDVHFVECPYEDAAPGAKGVGEIPMDGLAPAIANAIEAATGIRVTELPITPEKLFEKLS